uniref:uncharacterized protein LOC131128251 n=1 Tax=Doryrhamphus excisus TaxID=161450 RepID=UPI0025ADBB85|nr:uncharacterized protein LOC131128251 [Doryrhamphus excisus]
METLDEATVSLLQAANITNEVLPSLTREDLRDLLPGPENFLRRKCIWATFHPEEILTSEVAVKPAGDQTSLPQTSTPRHVTPKKIMKISSPDYVIYIDTELEQVRKYYFELQRCGRAHECTMSKELRCRLVRNTMTSMISILRANEVQEMGDSKYPSREEVSAMAKMLTEYYPMLQDKDSTKQPWEAIFRQLIKRLQNVRSTQNLMSQSTPKPSPTLPSKKPRLQFKPNNQDNQYDADSSASTENTDPLEDTPTDQDSDDTVPGHYSRKLQARHYKTLKELWKRPRPNQDDVAHLLDLEFESRRAFIDSCSLKEENMIEKVIEAYPCFKDHKHIMDELGRILQADNKNFADQIKARWESFCQNALFFGVWNKSLKPPMGLDKSGQAIALFKALPSLFPSLLAPTQKAWTSM